MNFIHKIPSFFLIDGFPKLKSTFQKGIISSIKHAVSLDNIRGHPSLNAIAYPRFYALQENLREPKDQDVNYSHFWDVKKSLILEMEVPCPLLEEGPLWQDWLWEWK